MEPIHILETVASMLNKELVPILAEIWGVPFERAWTIDRALANAGYRRKWKGPNPPHMTRREALVFLLACMVAEKATKAGDEVKPWVEAEGSLIQDMRLEDCPADEYAALGYEPTPEMIEEQRAAQSIIRNRTMRDLLDVLKYTPEDHSGLPSCINIVSCMMAVCSLFESSRGYQFESFKLEINVSNGFASASFNNSSAGDYSQIYFTTNEQRSELTDYDSKINRYVTVYGEALMAITVRTETPDKIG